MEQIVNKGFNYSGCYKINILFKSDNFYVMDNHGAALWTWLQHFDKNQIYNLIHIDKHYDTNYANLEPWVNSLPENLKDLSIVEYFEIKHKLGKKTFQTIRWDNYLSIFNFFYEKNISNYIFYTHKDGTSGIKTLDQDKVKEWSPISLFENFADLIINNEEKSILNLDIDYFYGNYENKYFQLYSDESIDILFNQIQHCYLNTNKIEVLSVALSPECCGGWKNSVRIYNKLAKRLKIEQIKIDLR